MMVFVHDINHDVMGFVHLFFIHVLSADFGIISMACCFLIAKIHEVMGENIPVND